MTNFKNDINITPLIEPTVLFIASPNLGILDQWLPVLHNLKKKNKDEKIFAIFPNERVVTQIQPGDFLTEFGEGLFDGAIYKTWFGKWIAEDSLKQANIFFKNFEKQRKGIVFLRRLSKFFYKFPIIKPLAHIIELVVVKIASTVFDKSRQVSLDKIAQTVRVICFDISTEKKDHFSEFLSVFKNASWFSLRHGNNLLHLNSSVKELKSRNNYKFIAYAYSSKEIPYHRERYNLDEDSIRVVGIPRHQSSWVNEVIEYTNSNGLPKPPYIFVVSRPANSLYFPNNPKESKKKLFEEVKMLSQEIGCNVVIRLHPKEKKEGIIESVFDESLYGEKWTISLLHPFLLGINSLFCITLYSGIAIDMVALGVPVVERCYYADMANTSAFVNNSEGRPSSLHGRPGLFLEAGNFEELKAYALMIKRDRDKIVKQQQAQYNKLYYKTENPIEIIVADIEQALASDFGHSS